MARRLASRPLGVLVASVVLSGCNTYTAVTAPAAGSTVRARLTVEEAVRWSELRGEPLRTVQGRVVRQDAQGLHLDVLLARSASQFRPGEFRDTLVIAPGGLESVSVRAFSPWRTGILALGLAAASYVLVDKVLVGGSDEGGGPGGGTQQSRVPLITIPIGR